MKVFSMFSGVGGFDLACQNLGMQIIGACESDPVARDIYRRNFPGIQIWEDARDVDPNAVPDFDLLCAGFPCQSFSIAGKQQGRQDPRGEYFLEVSRIVRAKKPSHLLLENVQGLQSIKNGDIIRDILAEFDELHYDVEICLHNTADYLPQNRPRVFFVCTLRTSRKSTKEILPNRFNN